VGGCHIHLLDAAQRPGDHASPLRLLGELVEALLVEVGNVARRLEIDLLDRGCAVDEAEVHLRLSFDRSRRVPGLGQDV
jgi:hypothetical protein